MTIPYQEILDIALNKLIDDTALPERNVAEASVWLDRDNELHVLDGRCRIDITDDVNDGGYLLCDHVDNNVMWVERYDSHGATYSVQVRVTPIKIYSENNKWWGVYDVEQIDR